MNHPYHKFANSDPIQPQPGYDSATVDYPIMNPDFTAATESTGLSSNTVYHTPMAEYDGDFDQHQNHPYRPQQHQLPYPQHEYIESSPRSQSPLRQQQSSPNHRHQQQQPPQPPTHSAHASITGTPKGFENHDLPSPPSNPLSTTSSFTNVNQLNQMHQQTHSRSESNLTAPPKNSHMRSTSSSSSFFYERPDAEGHGDFGHNFLQQYLGPNSNTLLPRMKTIELYRKNAKKSNDPTVLFQYAQYMLQTALMLDNDQSPTTGLRPELPAVKQQNSTTPTSPAFSPASYLNHKSSKSANSLDLNSVSYDEKKLKKELLKEALHYLRKLADKGYVDAQYLLADAYSSGALGKIDNREAFVLFQAAAKHGHVESAYRTSYCYEEGLGTGRDARKAIEFLKFAASKNHPAAMYKLGVYSFYSKMGLTTSINTKKMGIKWLTRATTVANELIASAPYELGKIYFNGFEDIVIPDQRYALELYSQAAALGHIQSAAILGHYYEVGEIVSQDSNLSIHYYTQAAIGGDPEAMLAMCAWYLVGNDPYLPKDEQEAFEWAKRSALCDFPKAQFALGHFYERGIGCVANPNESQNWYTKAAENGDERALNRINNQEKKSQLSKKIKRVRSNKSLNGGAVKAGGKNDKECVIV